MNNICVIIPMYGKAEYTRKCIELCIKHAGIVHDILVVDDGSPDMFYYGNEEDAKCPVTVLRLRENSGYTNATNQGLIWAMNKGYQYAHLLNNDTEPKENFLKILLDAIEKRPEAGVMSSVRIMGDEQGYVELFGVDLLRGYQAVTKVADLKAGEVIECNWVPVCSALIRMDMVQYLGLLNKKMKNHCSDLEYCLRARINGWKIFVATDSKVLHFHEVTTKELKIVPDNDQRVLLEILSGIYFAQFMKVMPLDSESKTFGQLNFEVIKK